MNREEKLEWEIGELRKLIDADWAALASGVLTSDKRKEIIEHIQLCNNTLKVLRERLLRIRAEG